MAEGRTTRCSSTTIEFREQKEANPYCKPMIKAGNHVSNDNNEIKELSHMLKCKKGVTRRFI